MRGRLIGLSKFLHMVPADLGCRLWLIQPLATARRARVLPYPLLSFSYISNSLAGIAEYLRP